MQDKKGYKHTKLGLIPEDWEIKKFKEVADFKNGINFSKNQLGKGILTLDVLNMYGHGVSILTDKLYKVDIQVSENNYQLINGDLLFVRSSLKKEGVGWTTLFDGFSEPVTFCGFIIRARFKEFKLVYPKYFAYFFRSPLGRKEIISFSGTVAITNISQDSLGLLNIPLPPHPEQKKIADILSAVDEQIANTDAIIKETQQLKNGLMQKFFTRGIGHTKFKKTKIGMIPEEWKVDVILNVYSKIIDFRGRTPKKLGMKWGNGNIRALSANNVEMGKINFKKECYFGSNELYDKWMTKGDVEKGDIIFTMEAPLGNVAQIPDENKYILSQRVILIKPKSKILLNTFLRYYLSSKMFKKFLIKFGTGSTAIGIKQKYLIRIPIPLPPLQEQMEITNILLEIDNKIDQEQQTKQELEQLKKGLMQQLLTGKKRINI